MNQHTLKVLEFDKIKDILKRYTVSELGREIVQNLTPISDLEKIKSNLKATSEVKQINLVYQKIPLEGLCNIFPLLEKIKVKGVILNPVELLNISHTIQTARIVKKFFSQLKAVYPHIFPKVQRIEIFSEIGENLRSSIGDQGEILDSASSKLREIREQIRVTKNQIKENLEETLNNKKFQKVIQEKIVTLRRNRYVIPVKTNFRSCFHGIVHDQSSGQATLFVEPLTIVNLNNKWQQLEVDEKDEILVILKRLTQSIYENRNHIRKTTSILAELDFIQAKAIFSKEFGGNEPILNKNGFINLKQACHPLLIWRQKVKKPVKTIIDYNIVPIDIHLGSTFDTLVITGPNTGGKTVALKTVGLLTLMAQSGLHIPSEEGSEIAIFKSIFADIGDEQNIQQNLSTFSSHITNIIDILKQSDSSSLALLDELGAGTEPNEGAALGIAILEFLHQEKVKTIATTHHNAIKAFAYTEDGISNASVEFNQDTLQPTYKILIGLPGKSNAFLIASKLGLPSEIIDQAQKRQDLKTIKVENLIENLEKDYKSLEEERKTISQEIKNTVALKKEYHDLLQRSKFEAENIQKDACLEAEKIVEETRKKTKEIIQNIKLKGVNKESIAEKDRELSKIKDSIHEKRPLSLSGKDKKIIRNLKVGEEIFIPSLKKQGVVLSHPSAAGEVEVQINNMRVQINLQEIERTTKHKKKTEDSHYTIASHYTVKKEEHVAPKINVIGYQTSEALSKVDKYLDQAFLNRLSVINIVHGKGTGTLRKAISEMLSGHPLVENFRLGEISEGGIGVTIVNIKT